MCVGNVRVNSCNRMSCCFESNQSYLECLLSSFIIIHHYYIAEMGDLTIDLMIDMITVPSISNWQTKNTIGAVCLAIELHVLC